MIQIYDLSGNKLAFSHYQPIYSKPILDDVQTILIDFFPFIIVKDLF
jgi:hypothetical protein